MKKLLLQPSRFVHFQKPGFASLVGAIGLALVLNGLLACAPNGQPGTSTRPTKLRLFVGEIKEISFPTPTDSSAQVLATSENPEVVDVSRRETINEGAIPSTGPTSKLNFLLKGVTAGKVRVLFSEKPAGSQDPERIRKTYLVEVVTK